MILQAINNSCKALEELSTEFLPTKKNAASIRPLQALKSLKLRNASCEDLSFIPVLKKLRELELRNCRLPHNSDQFAFLTQLTKLQIFQVFTAAGSFDVVDMISRLINLEELTVSDTAPLNGFTLDAETFSEIVNVVKGRSNVLILECRFSFFYNSKIRDKNS